MKKKIKFIVAIVIILIFSYAYSHISKTHMIYDKHIDSSNYLSTGIVEGKVEQEFVCVEEKIDGISAKCSVLGDVSAVSVNADLIECDTNKIVGKSTIKGTDLVKSKFNVFKMDTISGCKGKKYKVVFECENADSIAGNGVAFSIEPKVEDNTNLIVDNQSVEGTLVIKSVTNRFDIETMIVLLIFIVYIILFMKVLYKLFR